MDSPRIVYQPREDATPEVELSALAAVYKFVVFDSQESKGGPNDLTKDMTKECTISQDKKGQDSADIYRN
jgi:hypothetical protein